MKHFRNLKPAVAIAGAVLFAPVAQAEEIKLDLANEYSAKSLPGRADTYFADILNANDAADIQVTLHPGGGLGFKSRDHFFAVREGTVDMASAPTEKYVGIAPIFGLQSLPFISSSIDETKALYDIARPYYEEAFAQNNQVLIYSAPWTPKGVWAKERITTVEDLQGLKVRTLDVMGTKTFAAAGASPIQMSWGDVAPALSTGAIDAVLASDEGGVSGKIWELGAGHFNFLAYNMGINVVTLNKDRFDAMSPAQQEAVLAAGVATESFAWTAVREAVERNKVTMAENGAEYFTDVPANVIAHLQEAGAPLHVEWKADMGDEGDKILAAYSAAR